MHKFFLIYHVLFWSVWCDNVAYTVRHFCCTVEPLALTCTIQNSLWCIKSKAKQTKDKKAKLSTAGRLKTNNQTTKITQTIRRRCLLPCNVAIVNQLLEELFIARVQKPLACPPPLGWEESRIRRWMVLISPWHKCAVPGSTSCELNPYYFAPDILGGWEEMRQGRRQKNVW